MSNKMGVLSMVVKLSNKQIAEGLSTVAMRYPDVAPSPGARAEVVLTCGSLKLSCIPVRSRVLKLSERYRKARAHSPPRNAPSPRNAPRVYRGLIEAGDYQDAVSFWLLRHPTVFFAALKDNEYVPLADASEFTAGFVVARSVRRKGLWSVTHLDSGRACNTANNKAAAIEAFKKIDSARVEKAVSQCAVGQQQAAMTHYGISLM